MKVWLSWLAAVIGSFAVLEHRALRTGTLPTLSVVLRKVMGIHPRAAWGRLTPAAFLGFWMWLTAHLVRVRVREEVCR